MNNEINKVIDQVKIALNPAEKYTPQICKVCNTDYTGMVCCPDCD